jgi:hypothetical protein
MKQITPEIRQRIFALYFGQKIMRDNTINKPYPIHGANIDFDPEDAWLEVKPLTSLSDEDAIELCGILKYKEDDYFTNNFGLSAHMYLIEHIENDKNGFLGYVVTESFRILEAANFLRSKGYALPAFGYSVDELVAAGVFKLKEVTNDSGTISEISR